MIEEVRELVKLCPYIKDFAPIDVDRSEMDVPYYSINAGAGGGVINNFMYEGFRGIFSCLLMSSYYITEVSERMDNLNFGENFSIWLIKQRTTLQNIIDKKSYKITVENIQTDGQIYIFYESDEKDKARYALNFKIIYLSEGELK